MQFGATFVQNYFLCWTTFCVVALALFQIKRKSLQKEYSEYPRFICVPWKLAIFLPAFLFVSFAGRFTDDETWDIVSGGGMSILTYVTSAWSIGVVFKVLCGKKPLYQGLLAIAFWLFSCSWFYDAYLLIRDGHYTTRWFGNLILSSQVYLAAGLVWNLETTPNNRISFSFFRQDWPALPQNHSYLPILIAAIPLILIAAFLLVGFVGWHF